MGEKQVATVRGQVRTLGIEYPMMDNDYVTRRAYSVQAWPSLVILDQQGRIRYGKARPSSPPRRAA
jgi:transcriptional regulator of nitric oxide reductase